MPPARPPTLRAASLPLLVWLLVLLLPAATSQSAWHDWDIAPVSLWLASAWSVVALRLLLPGRAFFALTYPIAVAAVACVAADLMRNVNLAELALHWRTFSSEEVRSALGPYLGWLVFGAACLAALGWLGMRADVGRAPWPLRRRLAVVVAGSLALALGTPTAAWARAWPVNGLLLVVAAAVDTPWLALQAAPPDASLSPRDPRASWQATRAVAPRSNEAYVLVIGESMRSDFLSECGGPRGVRSLPAGALVACDVSAGSNATHTSMPLLISREMPGHSVRVSADATFQRAFSETGFETFWFDVQDEAIAWPDASVKRFPTGQDRAALLPLLNEALSHGSRRVSVVLHTYGSHEPYCSRFDRQRAPFGDLCDGLVGLPNQDSIASWRAMYANAVDNSIGLLHEIAGRLERQPGPVFLVFTPDHGENLLDDRRQLFGHALRHPTRWDIQVPAIFWANGAWREAHPRQWAQLVRNVHQPLMHADLVPTLLSAADIRYAERRPEVVDLLSREVPDRQRTVQTGIGDKLVWQDLRAEAR